MPELESIEVLKILSAYKVSSSALNENVLGLDIVPKEIRTANGVAVAHTKRQAIAMIMGRYNLLDTIKPDDVTASLYESACDTESREGYGALKKVAGLRERIAEWLNSYFGEPESQEQSDMLDILHSAATDKASKYYSPGYVKFLNWVDARKRNYKAYLLRHADKVELGDWNSLPTDKQYILGRNFLVRHNIHGKYSKTIDVPGKMTKKWLLSERRRTLNGMKKPELVKEYNAVTRGPEEGHGQGELVETSATVQPWLF